MRITRSFCANSFLARFSISILKSLDLQLSTEKRARFAAYSLRHALIVVHFWVMLDDKRVRDNVTRKPNILGLIKIAGFIIRAP